jgi:hypothetical protein
VLNSDISHEEMREEYPDNEIKYDNPDQECFENLNEIIELWNSFISSGWNPGTILNTAGI